MPNNLLFKRASVDFARQVFTLTPMIALFVFSKEKAYFQVSLITSATTLSTAVILFGLNVIVLIPENAKYIKPILKFSVIASPLPVFASFMFLQLWGRVDIVAPPTLLAFLVAEVFYGFGISLIGRFSLGSTGKDVIMLANLISPLVRGFSFFFLIDHGIAWIGIYFNVILQLSIFFYCFLQISRKHHVDSSVRDLMRLTKIARNVWLSSL